MQKNIMRQKIASCSEQGWIYVPSFFSMIICRSIEADLILRRRFRHTINLLFLFGGFFAVTFLRGLLLRVFTGLQMKNCYKFGLIKSLFNLSRDRHDIYICHLL